VVCVVVVVVVVVGAVVVVVVVVVGAVVVVVVVGAVVVVVVVGVVVDVGVVVVVVVVVCEVVVDSEESDVEVVVDEKVVVVKLHPNTPIKTMLTSPKTTAIRLLMKPPWLPIEIASRLTIVVSWRDRVIRDDVGHVNDIRRSARVVDDFKIEMLAQMGG
jgi:hypothetical protein